MEKLSFLSYKKVSGHQICGGFSQHLTLLATKCVEISPHTKINSPHQQGVQELSSILTLSTQREHQILQVQGSVPQGYHSPQLQMTVASPALTGASRTKWL